MGSDVVGPAGSAAGRAGREAVDDVEHGRAVADCVGDRAEEESVRCRAAENGRGWRSRPARAAAEHAQVDAATAEPGHGRGACG